MFSPSGSFSCSLPLSLLGTPKGHQSVTSWLSGTHSPSYQQTLGFVALPIGSGSESDILPSL